MSNNLYFCGVKSNKRHEVAAQMQRFLCQHFKGEKITARW